MSSPAIARTPVAAPRPAPQRPGHRVAGVDFNLISAQQCMSVIVDWAQQGLSGAISLVNPHSILLGRRDPQMRNALERSALVLPDGIGVVVGARMLGYPNTGRTSGPELMLYICDEGRKHQLRHYFYGGQPGVAEELANRLAARFPRLQVAGTYTPPFRTMTAEEDREALDRINASGADIVWVGLGAPKQEKWIAEHLGRLRVPALIGVGAAFDFHSGNIPWCPAPIRKMGLEWAYRLAKEPRRLWRRNLDSFLFLAMVSSQLLGKNLRRGM
jgi:N-acetylglucosaminyldiphosphoundecaprenol N-acetyl-beta-D-mannosaminyltransferase